MNRAASHIRRHAIVYIVVACCLTAASTVGAQAAGLAKNSVVSKTIKNGEVKAKDLASGSVTSAKVKDDSLTGADIDETSLDLDLPVYQQRVDGTCPQFNAIGEIAEDGSVSCRPFPQPESRPIFEFTDLPFDLEGGIQVVDRFSLGYLCPGDADGLLGFANTAGSTMDLWYDTGGGNPAYTSLAANASLQIPVSKTGDRIDFTFRTATPIIGRISVNVRNNPGNCLLLAQGLLNR